MASHYVWKDLFRVLVLGLFSVGYVKCSCTTPPPVANGEIGVIEASELIMHHCLPGFRFANGATYSMSQCDGVNFPPTGDNECMGDPYGPSGSLSGCGATPPPAIANAVAVTLVSGSYIIYETVYKCIDGFEWLSKLKYRVSSCNDASWIKVHDICEEEAGLPRDCWDVKQLGIMQNAQYLVIPSGDEDNGKRVLADCVLTASQAANGGGWTNIFTNDVNDALYTDTEYIEGYNTYDMDQYFVGLEFLSEVMTKLDPADPERLMTLDILFFVAPFGDPTAYATYNNFKVGPAPTYTMESLGTYHGTAGNSLIAQLGGNFQFTGGSASWWTDLGEAFPTKGGLWPGLDQYVLYTHVLMRIRPTDPDEDYYCPPLVGEENFWLFEGTMAFIPFSRSPGTIIDYTCLSILGQEGRDPGPRSQYGAILCQYNDPPTWNYTAILPCEAKCPAGFGLQLAVNKMVCYKYSTTQLSYLDANTECSKINCSLMNLQYAYNIELADQASYLYYVANSARGIGQEVLTPSFPYDTTVTCKDPAIGCNTTEIMQCMLGTKAGEYQPSDCNTLQHYICEYPAWCPDNYVNVDGICYKAYLPTDTSSCSSIGAAGAYPNTLSAVVSLTNYLTQIHSSFGLVGSVQDANFYIGINDVAGDFTAGGIINMASDLVALLGTSSDHYRILKITATGYEFIPTNHMFVLPESVFVCKYPSPLGCRGTVPPVPTISDNQRYIWDTTTIENSIAVYICYPGYFFFFNSTVRQAVEFARCSGITGGWSYSINPCLPQPVCQNTLPFVRSPYMTTTFTNVLEDYYLNSTIIYSCPAGMTYLDGSTTYNSTCTHIMGTMFDEFDPTFVPPCSVCLGTVAFPNATTNWTAGTHLLQSQILVTCTAGLFVSGVITEQTVACSENGWAMASLLPCTYPDCPNSVPLPGLMASMEPISSYSYGAVVTYKCSSNAYFLLTLANPSPTNVSTTNCSSTGVWVSDRGVDPLECEYICVDSPPVGPTPLITSDWDTTTRVNGTVITYTAGSPWLMGNEQTSVIVVCNNREWVYYDALLWPATIGLLNETVFTEATAVCRDAPVSTFGGGSLYLWNGNPMRSGDFVAYECPFNEASASGLRAITSACLDDATWEAPPSTFLCVPACTTSPPRPPEGASYNFLGDVRVGEVVTYQCPLGFNPYGESNITVVCLASKTWSVTTILYTCGDTVTQPPDTTLPPYVLTTLPVESEQYTFTSTKNYGQLESEMTTITSGPQVTILNAPFGHGTGITTESKYSQCMEKQNFVPAHLKCLINPKYCTNGLSFSIWVKNIFHSDSQKNLTDLTEADNRYFVSTGGSTNGQAGIALYSNKAWIIAIVSTAEEYWITKVLGPIPNNTWSNLGVRFNKNDFGLELFVNSSKVGGTMNSISVNPTLGIIPPTLVIGCLKNSAGSPLYQYFSDSSFDEFAIWDPCLEMENINYFMGGHKENMSDIVAEQFELILNSVDLADPDQQAAAKQIVQSLLGSEIVEPSQASPSDVPVSGNDSSVVSTMNPNDINIAKSFLVKAKIMVKLLNDKKVATTIPVDRAKRMLEIKSTVSDMLVKGNTDKWKNVQKLTEDVGGMQMVNTLIKYEQAILRSIPWPIGTDPECLENIEKSLYSKSCKMTIRQFQAMGNKIQEPTYTQPRMIQMRKNWDGFITDYIKFPTNIFTDPRCFERPLTYTAFVFDAVSKYATTKGHPVQFNTNTPKAIDSRITSVKLTPDLAKNEFGERLTEEPLCEPDVEAMMYSTLVIRAEHQTKSPANYIEKRKLLLFEDVSESTVEERFCVWWNENVSDIGVWDKSGCSILETNSQYTTCACQHFGIFAVLAVLSEPIEVPEEPSWLTTVRFILYIVSIVAVLIYIVVVIISGDLKDQFHLIGVNLSVAILSGSILMLISDSDSIRDDRGSCAIVGAMIQLFYGAVGTWMLGLAHSSFRGITAGVIGGHLKGYMLLCWGAPIAFTGLPFLIFEPKNLGDDPRCFVAWDTMVKSIFFAPQTLYAVLGLFFALVVVFNLSTPALRKDNLIEDYGSFCRGASLLVMLLSVTWMLGFFAYLPILDEPDFYPIFQVLNSIAGICLLIFIGFGSARFRSFLLGTAKAKREQLRRHAFGLPAASEFDNKDYDLSTNLVPPEIPPS